MLAQRGAWISDPQIHTAARSITSRGHQPQLFAGPRLPAFQGVLSHLGGPESTTPTRFPPPHPSVIPTQLLWHVNPQQSELKGASQRPVRKEALPGGCNRSLHRSLRRASWEVPSEERVTWPPADFLLDLASHLGVPLRTGLGSRGPVATGKYSSPFTPPQTSNINNPTPAGTTGVASTHASLSAGHAGYRPAPGTWRRHGLCSPCRMAGGTWQAPDL